MEPFSINVMYPFDQDIAKILERQYHIDIEEDGLKLLYYALGNTNFLNKNGNLVINLYSMESIDYVMNNFPQVLYEANKDFFEIRDDRNLSIFIYEIETGEIKEVSRCMQQMALS